MAWHEVQKIKGLLGWHNSSVPTHYTSYEHMYDFLSYEQIDEHMYDLLSYEHIPIYYMNMNTCTTSYLSALCP